MKRSSWLVLLVLLALGAWMARASLSGNVLHGEWEALGEPDPQLTLVFGPGNKCLVHDRMVDYATTYQLAGSQVRLSDPHGCWSLRMTLEGDPAGLEVGAEMTWLDKNGAVMQAPRRLRLRRVP